MPVKLHRHSIYYSTVRLVVTHQHSPPSYCILTLITEPSQIALIHTPPRSFPAAPPPPPPPPHPEVVARRQMTTIVPSQPIQHSHNQQSNPQRTLAPPCHLCPYNISYPHSDLPL
ncbi:hypothetical protein PGT21_033827 [Puccinia graminis f. sp. tritici]|uniref:Uncharacterized protein n=1 Tax=Puccinia graminis f. sp. tritici TaxID=56615 RepID=A0A5B0Q7C9_PUCGR|nr:hypothetical protein PGT21_033827 [Puccinia graminis f. sp. tritici]